MTSEAFPEVEAFSWVRETVLGEAACITLVQSGDVAAAARGFGGDPGSARRLTLEDARAEFMDEDADHPWIGVRIVGPYVLAVEVDGWQGSRPEVLERISAGTRAVSTYWNVNGTTRFSCAAAGRVLTSFDPLFPDRRHGDDPDGLESVRAGLPWDAEGADEGALPVPLALALAARVTGLPAEPWWFDGIFEVIPVQAVPPAIRGDTDSDAYTEPLTYDDPPLAWALRHASAARQRAAAQAAARYAIDLAGLADHPDVVVALRGDHCAADAGLATLLAALDRECRTSRGDPRPAGRTWAVSALREAASPQPLNAAFTAIQEASSTAAGFGDPPSRLRELVMTVLGHPAPPSGSLGLTASPGPWAGDKYQWTALHWLAPVGCITFVRDLSPVQVVEAFGGDVSACATGLPGLFPDPVTAIRADSGWTVVVDHHDPMGLWSRHAHMRPGPAVSLSWGARSRAMIHYVADGRVVATLEPHRMDFYEEDDRAVFGAYTADLPLADAAPWPAECLPMLLVLAERLTGVTFTPESLDQPHILTVLPGPA